MKNRLVLFVAALAVGTFLCFSSRLAVAQQADTGPNAGQQGEFQGEHVDTGVAAIDTGPEAAEAPEAARTEDVKLSPSAIVRTSRHPTFVPGKVHTSAKLAKKTNPMSEMLDVVQGPGPNLNLNLEQGLDLQEIGGVEAPGVR